MHPSTSVSTRESCIGARYSRATDSSSSPCVTPASTKSTNRGHAADVTVSASNLTGQLKSVDTREIREAQAIYYIGEVGVANRETLIFDISVKPEGETAPFTVRFRQQFYTS